MTLATRHDRQIGAFTSRLCKHVSAQPNAPATSPRPIRDRTRQPAPSPPESARHNRLKLRIFNFFQIVSLAGNATAGRSIQGQTAPHDAAPAAPKRDHTMRIAFSAATFAATLIATGAEPKLAGPRVAKVATLDKLTGSAIDYGNLATTFSPGYTLIDQNTVKCAKACTIVIDANEEVGNAAATGNWFAVCPVVDGNFSAAGCPYTGEVLSDYGYIYARARQTFPVARGTHTVQVYLYLSSASADSDVFDTQYSVYSP
jgi:hypothetical protein